MKRLVISVGIIGLFIVLACLHVNHLTLLTQNLTEQLDSVRANVQQDYWSAAQTAAQEIDRNWEKHAFYFHTTLHHTDIDAIRSSLKELAAYLESREDKAECLSVIAKLDNQLELLLEAELPTIKNLL